MNDCQYLTQVTIIIVLSLVLVSIVSPLAVASTDFSQVAASSSYLIQDEHISITDVSIEPSEPKVGEESIVRVTVRNQEESNETVYLDEVLIESGATQENLAIRRLQGEINPGSEVTIPLTATFENSGAKPLRVEVFGETQNGTHISVWNPFSVTVTDTPDGEVSLTLDSKNGVAGVQTPITALLENTGGNAVKDIDLTISGDEISVSDRPPVDPMLSAGDNQQYVFQVIAEEPGSHEMVAELSYTTTNGVEHTEKSINLVIKPLNDQADLQAGFEENNKILINIHNVGNAPMEDVVIHAEGDSETVLRPIQPVSAHSTETVSLKPSSFERSAKSNISVNYTIAGQEKSIKTTVSFPEERVELTQLKYDRKDDVVRISGSASNVGKVPAKGVSVSVVDTAHIDPAFPGRRYFIGTVPASDFAGFDVTADPGPNATELKLEASWLANGEETSRIVSLPVPDKPKNRIDLTELNYIPEGQTVRISGSASNVGEVNAESVSVSVVDTEHIDSAFPKRKDFVGTVPASDFAGFDVTADPSSNATEIRLNVSWLANGEETSRIVSLPVPDKPNNRIELTGLNYEREDGIIRVSGSISNVGEVNAESVSVSAVDSEHIHPVFPKPEHFVETVRVNGSADFDVTTDTNPNATELKLEVSWLANGEETCRVVSLPVPERPKNRIELTELNYEREDGIVRVSGSTSNVGEVNAESVSVSVVDTEHIDPAFPKRKYFVGTVPASDFAGFDVTADPSPNATELKLEVSWLANSEETRRVVSLPYESDRNEINSTKQNTILPWVIGGGVVLIVLAIIGIGIWNYHNRLD